MTGKMVNGMGGAMDLVASAKNIIVAMMHTNKRGESKLLSNCTFPITGMKCIKKIVTNLAVIEIVDERFVLQEYAPGVSIQEIIDVIKSQKIDIFDVQSRDPDLEDVFIKLIKN